MRTATREIIEDTSKTRRLIAFAVDAAHLADRRADLVLRQLVDDLHRDLIEGEEQTNDPQ